jgi:hypothetical protein
MIDSSMPGGGRQAPGFFPDQELILRHVRFFGFVLHYSLIVGQLLSASAISASG